MSAPWMKFYPTDWRADPALRVCSLGARGLWMEMLCVMHEAQPRGTLRINGQPMSAQQLASLVGSPAREVQRYLDELETAGVFSRDDTGALFSRRMVRDTEKAARDKANGKGGGNPSLKVGVNPPDKGRDKAQNPETRSQNPEEESPPTEARRFADQIGDAVQAYNEAAHRVGWPLAQRLTESRKTACRLRLAEAGGLDGWRDALAKAEATPFLCGENDRGWKASFDWLCKPANFTKLMEGAYDRSARQTNGHAAGRKPAAHDAVLAALGERFAESADVGRPQADPGGGLHAERGAANGDREPGLDLGPADYRHG